jgi:hypothetical protein
VLTTHAGTIRYAREADTLLFSRQAKQSRTSNRVMRFPQLPSFTFFAEIKFSVGTIWGQSFRLEGVHMGCNTPQLPPEPERPGQRKVFCVKFQDQDLLVLPVGGIQPVLVQDHLAMLAPHLPGFLRDTFINPPA